MVVLRAQLSAQPEEESQRGKFRSAADVFKRVRWDPAFDKSTFLIGVEDRSGGDGMSSFFYMRVYG